MLTWEVAMEVISNLDSDYGQKQSWEIQLPLTLGLSLWVGTQHCPPTFPGAKGLRGSLGQQAVLQSYLLLTDFGSGPHLRVLYQ